MNHEPKTGEKSACEERPHATRKRRVLLAEDNNEMRSLLALELRSHGYDVTECHDGDQLVDHIVTPDPGVDFDLIVSDIRMPAHSGLELLDAGQQLEGFPPMILITAFGSEITHARARRLGAVAVFDKPFDVDDLLGKVEEVLSPK